MEVAGGAVDVVKLGWGTAVATANLREKLARYRAHGIPVVLGGTLTELAIAQGRVEELVGWVKELGIEHVEVSDGTITLARDDKLALIRRLAGDFTVLSEVGSKDATVIMAPYRWVEQIQQELEAGGGEGMRRGRGAGTAGLQRPPRRGLMGPRPR